MFKMQTLNCLSPKSHIVSYRRIIKTQNVQNAKAQLCQFQNLNSESRTVGGILCSTYNEISHMAVKNSKLFTCKKVKVARTRLPSVGFRSWSRFLAVSPQVTWVINPAVGCRSFPPGPQLPWQPFPIPIFGILVFPVAWESHGTGNHIPMHIFACDARRRAVWWRS